MDDDRLFDDVIDLKPRKRRFGLVFAGIIIIAILLFGSQLLSVYIDSLWFSTVGYSSVYWYKFRLGGLLFLTFFIVTFLIIRVPFTFLSRLLPELIDKQNIRVSSAEDI